MNALKSISLVAVAVLAAACGTAIGSKEDAAKAVHSVGTAGQMAGSPGGSPLFFAPVTFGAAIEVKGKSGTASVKFSADASGGNGVVQSEITYKNFSADGTNFVDGVITQDLKTENDISGGNVSTKASVTMKGKVTISGDFDDTLDMDITESVETSVGGGAATVSAKIKGHVTTGSGSYDYNDEAFTFAAKT